MSTGWEQGGPVIGPGEAVLPIRSESAWKSMPGVVRLAVWIWALTVVLSVIVGILGGLVFLLALAGS